MKIKYFPSKDKRVLEFNKFIEEKFPLLLKEKKPDLILVAGGDGAMHHAICDHYRLKIPFLGKALGRFNFLMNEFEDNLSVISDLLKNRIKINVVKCNNIAVYVNNKKIGEAVNDIVIGNSIMDYISFNIKTQDGSFNNFDFKGCGLCISTVIGSTAYNFNNNGMILPLNSGLWSITGIVCNRRLNDILHEQQIEIVSEKAKVFLSGIPSFNLKEGDDVTLRKGSQIKIAFLQKSKFVQRRIELAHRHRIASNGKNINNY